ncbi:MULTISPECIES: VirB3 family type IV secretion system protein [unclassified Caballeronia]|uniref:VirB3 family type IV secretion system protein n=1 Tax=unclassified Caballeronia TaxID=2646786 RepID=UPI002857C229|nr:MULTISPECIES: VirB3 family type IV secretion system protein [unclassified Caballeronia]MDR5777016.1 VirB3 family type IV secretion system protein [Caballeronia sp. LZ002]MDR5852409.1 VirB3 family type IV secretion system protein [Caballeronia sp. LZ003]
MADHRSELTQVTIHASGVRTLNFMGGDRRLVLGGAFFSLYLAFMLSMRYGAWYGVPASVVVWGLWIALMRRLAVFDPQWLDVVRRHRKYRAIYPARGRFNAPTPIYKDFK